MLVERDIAVVTRDGSPIVVDVFRPEGGEPVPVIASISPYGAAGLRAGTRGTGKPPGRLGLYGAKDAEDFSDVIEWAAGQPWPAGQVASSGISWLAMMGWRVAAVQPPHLAAVVAWEGSADFYRECACQGGLYASGSSSRGGSTGSSRSATARAAMAGGRCSPGIRWSTATTKSASPIWGG